jgi:hypothetical protein
MCQVTAIASLWQLLQDLEGEPGLRVAGGLVLGQAPPVLQATPPAIGGRLGRPGRSLG